MFIAGSNKTMACDIRPANQPIDSRTFFRCIDGSRILDGIGRDCEDGTDENIPLCGNGIIDAGENCDDGNIASLDGCSELCHFEQGFYCYVKPFHDYQQTVCSLVRPGEAVISSGVTFGGVSTSDLRNGSALQDSLAGISNVTSDQVIIDSISGGNGTNANSSVRVDFHTVVNGSDENAINNAQNAVNTASPEDLAATLSQNINRPVTVGSIQPGIVQRERDTTPPRVLSQLTSSNVLDVSIAGPTQTISLSVINASKPLSRIEIVQFTVGGEARTVQLLEGPRNAGLTDSSKIGLTYSVNARDNGPVSFFVRWFDANGNGLDCGTGNVDCTLGNVIADSTKPSFESNETVITSTTRSGLSTSRRLDRTLVLEFHLTGNVIGDISRVNISQFVISCDQSCDVSIEDVKLDQIERIVYVLVGIRDYGKGGSTIHVTLLEGAVSDKAGNINDQLTYSFTTPEAQNLSPLLFWILVGIAFGVSLIDLLFFIVMCIWKKRNLLLWRSTPLFNFIILSAILISLPGVPSLGMQVSGSFSKEVRDISCQAFPFFLSNPLYILLSVIIARNYRLHKVFNNPALRHIRISNVELLKASLIPIGANVVLNVVLVVMYPGENRLTESLHAPTYHCVYPSQAIVLVWIDLALFAFLVLVGTVVFIQIWRIPKGWNESRLVAYCFFSIVLVVSVVVPASIFVTDPDNWFVLTSAAVIAGAILPLVFLFMLKFATTTKKKGTTVMSTVTNAGSQQVSNGPYRMAAPASVSVQNTKSLEEGQSQRTEFSQVSHIRPLNEDVETDFHPTSPFVNVPRTTASAAL